MLRTRFRTRARFIPAVSGGGGGFSITNSLRFNDNDSAYLSRTPSVAGNRKTWTWSSWVKRGNIGSAQILFAASNESTTQAYMFLGSDDSFGYFDYVSASNVNVKTNALLRDVSGWYHLVVVFDTTQATGSDRVKIYINGTEQTVTYTLTPSLNYEGSINTTGAHGIGREEYGNAYYFDGYMAEVNFIDGQALTPDDFGEINATTGEWSPKAYAGTYGTNGFYLPFDGNANDDSGNGNNWTENNLASTDYMIDTPSNNFATLNSLRTATYATFSEGNLRANATGAQNVWNVSSTIGIPVSQGGKFIFEATLGALQGSPTVAGIGFITQDQSPNSATHTSVDCVVGYFNNGTKTIAGVSTSYGASYTTNDVIDCAIDVTNDSAEFFKNGVSQGTISSLGLNSSDTLFAFVGNNQTSVDVSSISVNFGADSSFAGLKTRQGNTDANGIGDFYYAPPAGYLALCTENTGGDPIADIT